MKLTTTSIKTLALPLWQGTARDAGPHLAA
jgi:hypothetical protein